MNSFVVDYLFGKFDAHTVRVRACVCVCELIADYAT